MGGTEEGRTPVKSASVPFSGATGQAGQADTHRHGPIFVQPTPAQMMSSLREFYILIIGFILADT